MIDITQSIKACAAFYGKDADAMELYLKEGEKKALDLGNRGPIKFDDTHYNVIQWYRVRTGRCVVEVDSLCCAQDEEAEASQGPASVGPNSAF